MRLRFKLLLLLCGVLLIYGLQEPECHLSERDWHQIVQHQITAFAIEVRDATQPLPKRDNELCGRIVETFRRSGLGKLFTASLTEQVGAQYIFKIESFQKDKELPWMGLAVIDLIGTSDSIASTIVDDQYAGTSPVIQYETLMRGKPRLTEGIIYVQRRPK